MSKRRTIYYRIVQELELISEEGASWTEVETEMLPPGAVMLTREQVEAAMWLASDRIQKAFKAGNVGQGDSFQEYMLDELFGKMEAGE